MSDNVQTRLFFEKRDGAKVVLDDFESLRTAKVLRLKIGEVVHLFNEKSEWFKAVLTERSKASLTLEIMEPLQQPPLPVHIKLIQAILEPTPMEWLLEKAVELGIAEVHPFVGARSENPQKFESRYPRFRKIIIEATRQSGNPNFLKLFPVEPFENILKHRETSGFILDPHSEISISRFLDQRLERVEVISGPESGFTKEEVSFAEHHGYRSVKIHANTLRAETAPITFTAMALAHSFPLESY